MGHEPKMGDPDWGRYAVTANQSMLPVGDPTRWGARVDTLIPLPVAVGGEQQTAQILQMATRDQYSRSWALLGNLTMPMITWQTPTCEVTCTLAITMGVGQIQIDQYVLLANFSGQTGLCFQQDVSNGGPYVATRFNPTRSGDSAGFLYDEARSFAIIGGLVGQSINIRAIYRSNIAAFVRGIPTTARLELIVTPFAAGEGM